MTYYVLVIPIYNPGSSAKCESQLLQIDILPFFFLFSFISPVSSVFKDSEEIAEKIYWIEIKIYIFVEIYTYIVHIYIHVFLPKLQLFFWEHCDLFQKNYSTKHISMTTFVVLVNPIIN